MSVGQEILFPTPLAVFLQLRELVITWEFWGAVGFSLLRITLGFLSGVAAGVLLAVPAYRYVRFREFLSPFVMTIKTIPVASFIIVVLIWVPSRNLSVLISFLMVFPILYTGVLEGIRNTDRALLEMATVFEIPVARRVRYIYVSEVLPFFRAACTVALGLCWKVGIAAEVIGLPSGSVGENIYNAKIYLDTPNLFAWTVVIIALSILFEKLFLRLIRSLVRRLERG